MTLGERLKQLRKTQKMSQVEFGSRIGVSGATISTSESCKTSPDEQTIRAICSEFNVNRTWLETGEGEMYVSRPLLPELVDVLRKYPALKALMESAASLMTPADWEALNDFAQRWVDAHANDKNPTE